MIANRVLARVTVVMLLAGLLAGCSEAWRTTTYNPRRSCESFGGRYGAEAETCYTGGGP